MSLIATTSENHIIAINNICVSGESKVKGRVLLTSIKINQALVGSKHDIAEICYYSV